MEAERTQAGEDIIPEGVPQVEVLNRQDEEDKTPENDVGVPEGEDRGGGIHLEEEQPGVLEKEELPGVLEEEELELPMPSMLEEMRSLTGLTEDSSSVRCRNRRRKVKVSH